MPLPPFHVAPGAALKLVGLRYFSFSVFFLTQVLMDVEVLVRMIGREATLHGFSNTVLGATAIAVVSAVIGKPLCGFGLRCRTELYSRGLLESGGR